LGAGVGRDIAFNKQQQIHILIFLLLLFPFTVKEKSALSLDAAHTNLRSLLPYRRLGLATLIHLL